MAWLDAAWWSRFVAGAGVALVLAAGGPASAAGPDAPPARTMQAESQSADARVRALEQRLGRLVGELRPTMSADAWARLSDLQESWNAFVRADCAWGTEFSRGGSVASLVRSRCMQAHLAARIDRLRPFLCEGYGMTGECAASRRYAGAARR